MGLDTTLREEFGRGATVGAGGDDGELPMSIVLGQKIHYEKDKDEYYDILSS